MKRNLFVAALAALTMAAFANADVIGEPGPFGTGDVDGWSGITVMEGYGSIPAGQNVSGYNYFAHEDRADGNHHVQPLVVKDEGGAFSIWEVGPVSTPNAGGDHSGAWTSATVPDDGNRYLAAFWQWNEGVNNEAGGVVPFGSGGAGMFQHDADGTSYVPAAGDPVTLGHSSGAGGRSYQFNLETVPEPSSIVLALFAGLGFTALVRRRK